ncbi:MAG: ThuA domain-containing protein [Pseudomonadota bacterium]
MSNFEVLIVSKGHPYDHNAFIAMFEAFEGVTATLVELPAAIAVLAAPSAARYDVVFFYDMSGIPGVGLTHDDTDAGGQPSREYAAAINALLERGTGLMLVNHATVSWPHWPLWRTISGSPFMLSEGELDGRRVPGSGYRGAHGPLPNATVQVSPASDHPAIAEIGDGFEITDELYLKTADFEASVMPLLRADYAFVAENFSPPPLAPAEEQASWSHPPGSNLLAWANAAGNSPVIVSELGDGPATYENPGYRRFLAASLRWLASDASRAWAREWRQSRTGSR